MDITCGNHDVVSFYVVCAKTSIDQDTPALTSTGTDHRLTHSYTKYENSQRSRQSHGRWLTFLFN